MSTNQTAAKPATVTNAVAVRTPQNSVLMRLAQRFQIDQIALVNVLKATIMPKGTSDEHLCAFMLVADQYGLNPLTKQIYAFEGKGGAVVPIVSIDGWYSIVNAHGAYQGSSQRTVHDEHLGTGIETTIHRSDRTMPTVRTEWLNECTRNTEPWKQWPSRMLGHKSFIQCARAAFGLAGIYDPDEGERIQTATFVMKDPPAAPTGSRQDALADRLAPPDAQAAQDTDREPGDDAPEAVGAPASDAKGGG